MALLSESYTYAELGGAQKREKLLAIYNILRISSLIRGPL